MRVIIAKSARASVTKRPPHPANVVAWRRLPGALEALATLNSYHRGQEIYRPAARAETWYRVLSGLVRKCTMMADGRRRIVDFLLPGDFFGLTARHEHVFAVEAVVDGTVIGRYPRGRVETMANLDPEINQLVRNIAFDAIVRLEARILILGRTTAIEKVSAFMVEMAQRASDGAPFVLPMSRYDIADYLGLSVETVSRTITDLKLCGFIALAGKRHITILDRSALEERSHGGAAA
jgi:CRP/FNR family transcriptional regulator, nitrogen fixation regulation protein